MAEGTNPQKKDLLRRLVKKVLVHDGRTIEIWYGLPNQASICIPGIWLPGPRPAQRSPVGSGDSPLLPGGLYCNSFR
jgi:hypothetical protein